MIGKVIKGKSFKGCVSYVMGAEKAQLLAGKDVLMLDAKTIINSFYNQSLLNTNLTKCVGHIPLSYSIQDKEKLTDEFMIRLAREYMKEMEIENTQYIIVRHHNTEHPHCHIIYNRVDCDGKTISDKNDFYRNEKVTKALKKKYGLYFGTGKEKVNKEKLNEPDKTRYLLRSFLIKALKRPYTWEGFIDLLKKNNIEVKYKWKAGSNDAQGITFIFNGYHFKGSEIDRKLSLGNLSKHFKTKVVKHAPPQSMKKSKGIKR